MIENRTNSVEESSELKRLLQWIQANPQKWLWVCDPEFFDLPMTEKLELIKSLEKAGLYTVVFVVFWSAGSKSRRMEEIRNRFVNGLIAEFPEEGIMARINKVMEDAAEGDQSNS